MRRVLARAWPIIVAACGGSSHPRADAGVDAAPDASGPSGCEGFVEDGDRACIPTGRFWFGWISDDQIGNEGGGCLQSSPFVGVNSCAHELDLPAFAIDLREVSIGEYGAAVADGAVPAPPEFCGDYDHMVEGSDCDLLTFGTTGFDATGAPLPDWVQRPTACVTKDDARAYCAWKGGRLPLSTEWMKAARGASPSRREIPWADHVPLPFSTWNDLPAWDFFHDDGAGHIICEGLIGLPREPVTSRPENASPYGLLHVLGNVQEWVEVAPSGDLYEETGVDVLGFGEVRVGINGDTRISAGLPVERGIAGFLPPFARVRTIGFRCAYDP